jgi:uncharacterized protein (TIGR02265 family)
MADAPVVYTSSAEGLIRALGDRLDERAHQRFAEIGIPLRGKLQPAYPREVWLKAGQLASQLLSPHLPADQQKVVLGRRFVHGFGETIVGKALLAAMRVLGPKRALLRLERSLRTGNNYSTVTLRELGEGQLELEVSDAPFPEYYQGMVEASLELTGCKSWEVKLLKRVGNETTYSIRFEV